MHGHLRAVISATIAVVAVQGGQVEQARADVELAHRLAVDTADQPIMAAVGIGVAWLAAALDRPRDAAAILGASAVLRGADDPTDRSISQLHDRLRDRLGPALDAAVAAGSGLDRDGAVARIDPARLR
jgi:hypothetical protein